jgi:hypothetical protein
MRKFDQKTSESSEGFLTECWIEEDKETITPSVLFAIDSRLQLFFSKLHVENRVDEIWWGTRMIAARALMKKYTIQEMFQLKLNRKNKLELKS